MSKLRDFWVGIPAACGVPAGLAKWDGIRNGGWFDWEIENSDDVLRSKPGETDRQRLQPAFSGWEHLGDAHIVEYAKRFGAFVAARARFNKKGIGNEIELLAEEATLRVLEPGVPTVSALMSVDEAVQGNWS